jgi:hypothetical protein
VQPTQRGQVADLGHGRLGAGGEIELLQGGLLLELGAGKPPVEGDTLAAGDVVGVHDGGVGHHLA